MDLKKRRLSKNAVKRHRIRERDPNPDIFKSKSFVQDKDGVYHHNPKAPYYGPIVKWDQKTEEPLGQRRKKKRK